MSEACSLIWSALVLLFRSRASLAAEILVLRHQINILRRHSPKRQTFSAMDRLIFAGLYRLAPTVLNALAVLKPDTVIKWHRAGFRSYWRWRSRRRGGRPTLPTEIGKLIREKSIDNPLWGAPRIHGELLKLGIDIGQTSVAKYMVKRRGPPSQGWKTFLHNHADGIAAMDLFVVPNSSRFAFCPASNATFSLASDSSALPFNSASARSILPFIPANSVSADCFIKARFAAISPLYRAT